MRNRAICLCDFSQTLDQKLQSVHLDFQHRSQQHTELAGWKPLTVEPFEVRNREVGNDPILVFAERHFVVNQIFEDLAVRMC